MSHPPSSDRFIDPNERLLASVIPPPPPTLRARAGQFLTRLRPSDLRRVLDWSRSREGRACFLAALAGGALMIGLYRSEASSAASTAGALRHGEPSRATAAARASVRAQPRALAPEHTNAALLPAAMADATDREPSPARAAAGDPEPADAASEKTGSVGSTERSASASKKVDEKKVDKKKKKRRAKPRAVGRASTRAARRSKARRTTTPGPLAAWLANQRSKEASPKRR